MAYVGVDGSLIGLIYVEDTIRDDAVEVVKSLSEMGISTYMLSGDKEHSAEYVASIVGIPKVKVIIAIVLEIFDTFACLSTSCMDNNSLRSLHCRFLLQKGKVIVATALEICGTFRCLSCMKRKYLWSPQCSFFFPIIVEDMKSTAFLLLVVVPNNNDINCG